MIDYNKYRGLLQDMINHWQNNTTDSDATSFYYNFINDEYDDEFQDDFSLYKYMPPKYHNIRALEKQIIHLSPNGVLNDVFEGLPVNWTSKDIFRYRSELNDLAYISCFSESNNNNIMWGIYAANSTGFCVEYDMKELINSNSKHRMHLFPVLYSNERFFERDAQEIEKEMKYLREDISGGSIHDDNGYLNDIQPLFLIKDSSWEHEREWRIIYSKKQMYDENDEELYSQNISFPYIKAVYLGCNIEKDIRENIKEIISRLNSNGNEIKLYQCGFDKNTYDMITKEI